MYEFSQGSKEKILQLHPDLQFLMYHAIAIFDFSVTTGYRDKTDQNALEREGKSQLKYPSSKHNLRPSMAVDIHPYPINFEDLDRYYFLAGLIKGIASKHNIKIRWGGDWDNDNDFTDNKFDDLCHFELV